MEGFKRRYLVLSASIFLAFLAVGLNENSRLLLMIFALLLCAAFIVGKIFSVKNQNFNTVLIILLAASLLGTARSGLLSYKTEGVEREFCGERKICGYVKEISASYPYMSEYVISVESVDGEKVLFDAVAVTDFAFELSVGDAIECDGILSSLREYGEAELLRNQSPYDTPLVCTVKNEESIKITGEKKSIALELLKINSRLSSRLKVRLGSRNGALASALLLGNRELLDDGTLRDFKRAGVYHMLALSGLHVAILIGLLDFILQRLRANRFLRIAILSSSAVLYVALTGFKLSACRAMLMLLITYASYAVRKRGDSMTSLFLAVSIICFIFPSSVYDLGLQLSFLSTFGVIAASTICGKLAFLNVRTEGSPLRLKVVSAARYFIKLAISSLCVFIATLPVITECFGEVSIMTFFSNLFMGALCEAFMVLSVLAMIFGGVFSFLGNAAGNVMTAIVEALSSLDGAMLSLLYPNVKITVWGLFLTSLVLFAAKLKRKWLISVPSIAFILALIINVYIYGEFRNDFVRAEYLRGDVLVLSSESEVYICDASDGRYGKLYEGAEIAKQNCFTEIDCVILTHYHRYHATSLRRLANNFIVDSVALPTPQSKDEASILNAIVNAMKDSGTDIYVYEAMDGLGVAGGVLWISERAYSASYAHPSVALTFSYGESRVSLVEMPYFDTHLEKNELLKQYIYESDAVIFGSDGRMMEERFEIFERLKGGAEVVFTDREALLLSDFEPYMEDFEIYVDTVYKKYDLK